MDRNIETTEPHAGTGRVEFQLGNLTFTGEGPTEWLGDQVEKVLELAGQLQVTDVPEEGETNPVDDPLPIVETDAPFTTALARHIRERGGESNQVQRFLATADWLRRKTQPLNTTAVSRALRDNQQKKLANASDALNKNVGKGYCEKTSTGFFITPEGLKHLGYQND